MTTPQEEANHEVTAASTDAQINAKAARIAYTTGTHIWVLGQIFALQREVARLKAEHLPPHLWDVEQR
jgi:hypothetical protein